MDHAALHTDTPLSWSPLILSCEQGGFAVVLSLHDGRYHAFDEQGSRIWALVGGSTTFGALLQSVARDMDQEPEGIRADLGAFVTDLIGRKFLTTAPVAPPPQKLPRTALESRAVIAPPSVVVCIIGLLFTAIALRVTSLSRLWRFAHRRLGQPVDHASTASFVNTLACTMRQASAWSPLKAQCLEQSLLMLAILRSAGIDADLRFGVLMFPFRAHAWIEVDGHPVTDTTETLKLYRPLVGRTSWA